MRRRIAALILLLMAQMISTSAGWAQPPSGSVVLDLVRQPVWHGQADPLGLRLRITNQSESELEGFRLRVGVYDRVQSRSELHQSFDAPPFLEPSSFPVDFSLSVGSAESVTVSITQPVSDLATVGSAQEGGVFPMTVTLQSSDESVLDTLTTPLLYFPDQVERPLNLVLLVPLNEVPARGPSGVFFENTDDPTLEIALGESGWLRGMSQALLTATTPPPEPPPQPRGDRRSRGRRARGERRSARIEETPPRLRFAFAPIPRLLEEISDMADGYRRDEASESVEVDPSDPSSQAAAQMLEDLRTLIAREGVQPILVPYAYADLPSLTIEELASQLDAAQAALNSGLGESAGFSRRWLFPPAGRLDAATLEALRSLQAGEHTFASQAAFLQDVAVTPGCPAPFASFTCPVRMETLDSGSEGFVSDAQLQDLFGQVARAEPRARVELQRFFADTVQVWAELPGTRDRILYFALPTTWRPAAEQAREFFTALSTVPWLKTVTPEEALVEARPRPRPMVDFEDPPPVAGPSADEALDEAAARVESLAALIPTDDRSSAERQLLQRLYRNLLVARSRVWFEHDLLFTGENYATATIQEADQHFQNVRIGGAKEIALTSRRAPIQLLIANQNSHPVAVRVRLESQGLGLQEEVLDEIVPANRTRQIQIEAETRASGIFPLRVALETSDGYVIAETAISIRSTEFNEVALGVTIGALVFVIAFFVVRTLRKKPTRPAEGEPA